MPSGRRCTPRCSARLPTANHSPARRRPSHPTRVSYYLLCSLYITMQAIAEPHAAPEAAGKMVSSNVRFEAVAAHAPVCSPRPRNNAKVYPEAHGHPQSFFVRRPARFSLPSSRMLARPRPPTSPRWWAPTPTSRPSRRSLTPSPAPPPRPCRVSLRASPRAPPGPRPLPPRPPPPSRPSPAWGRSSPRRAPPSPPPTRRPRPLPVPPRCPPSSRCLPSCGASSTRLPRR